MKFFEKGAYCLIAYLSVYLFLCFIVITYAMNNDPKSVYPNKKGLRGLFVTTGIMASFGIMITSLLAMASK